MGGLVVTVCLLSWITKPFQDGVYLKGKEFSLSRSPLRRKAKMNITELLPLKLYHAKLHMLQKQTVLSRFVCIFSKTSFLLTLLHSEQPKLYGVLAVLSARGLIA